MTDQCPCAIGATCLAMMAPPTRESNCRQSSRPGPDSRETSRSRLMPSFGTHRRWEITHKMQGGLRRSHFQGFTLLELLIVCTVVAVLVIELQSIFMASQVAFSETTASAVADDSLRRVTTRIKSELRFVELENLSVINPQELSFSSVSGWDGEELVLRPRQTISFGSGQVLMNGNVMADGLKNLSFTLDDDLLTIDLEIEESSTVGGISRLVSRRVISLLRF